MKIWQGVKMQDWKMRHKKCRAGKCETSQYGKPTDTGMKNALQQRKCGVWQSSKHGVAVVNAC